MDAQQEGIMVLLTHREITDSPTRSISRLKRQERRFRSLSVNRNKLYQPPHAYDIIGREEVGDENFIIG